MENEIIRLFAQMYEAEMNRRRNEDYEINPEQMDKFLELLYFFRKKVDPEFDEGIEPFNIEAKEEHGGFSARFCVFDLHGEEIGEFARLIGCCTAVSIDVVNNSQICISVTVPEIFKEMKK